MTALGSSALADAIARSFTEDEPDRPAVSPLRALGRRQLSGIEVLAQSVATTAPAVSMVMLPVAMLTHGAYLSGMLTIVAATALVTLIAWCTSQFTRRMVASGGLYAFVFQGLGARAALTTGIAMAVKYLGSGALTLYHGGQALLALAAQAGIEIRGPAVAVVYLAIAAAILAALVRGVRFAALAILAVEACSLLFIIGLMVVSGESSQVAVVPSGSGSGLLAVVLTVLFALAGFESATFIGPEARRPMVTVTRTVLLTPVLCGTLFLVAGWAAWTGNAGTVVNAYLHGTATGVSPVVVAILHAGLCCSWLASAMASSNAASRMLYSMGVERVLPRACARVHPRLRTPWVALTVAVATILLVSSIFVAQGGVAGDFRTALRIALLFAYVLVAAVSVAFLSRIRELTGPASWVGRGTAAFGVVAGGYIVSAQCVEGHFVPLGVSLAVPAAATLWFLHLRRSRPRSLAAVGVFDSPESQDVLPGAGVFAENARGTMALVGADHPTVDRR